MFLRDLFHKVGLRRYKRKKVTCSYCSGLGKVVKLQINNIAANSNFVVSRTKTMECPVCKGNKFVWTWTTITDTSGGYDDGEA